MTGFQEKELRPKVGLALGGGVVRGMAHLGVLVELQRAGVPVDVVAGSSAGSLVGASFCAGKNLAEIYESARRLSWWQLARPVWPRRGFVTLSGVSKWLVSNLGDLDFVDLEIPFAAMVTDLQTGEAFALRHGRLASAVQASCSVPGFVTPVEIDGRLLGDGSLADTVPVGALRAMGADYVIGVDVFASSIRKWLGPIGWGLASLEILVQNAGGGLGRADCLIAPDLSGATYLRFSQRERLFRLGAAAARSQLPKICADLGLGLLDGEQQPVPLMVDSAPVV